MTPGARISPHPSQMPGVQNFLEPNSGYHEATLRMLPNLLVTLLPSSQVQPPMAG